jgi:DNA-binding PadR family transcriptional regulator
MRHKGDGVLLGSLAELVLVALQASGPLHGYRLGTLLLSVGYGSRDAATTTLRRLEASGHAVSVWSGSQRVYSITAAGVAALAAQEAARETIRAMGTQETE